VTRRFPADTAALAGELGILEEAFKWRAVNMRRADLARVYDEPKKSLDSKPILAQAIQIPCCEEMF